MASLLRVFAFAFSMVLYAVASSPQIPEGLLGTWHLNVAKSTSNVPLPQSNIVRWETVPGGWKQTGDIVDASGTIGHNELTTTFDGKDSDLKGVNAIPGTTRAFRRIDDRTYEHVLRINGRVLTTTRATLAADGRTRTLVTTGTNAAGQTVNSTMVWERR
jgi:hypothetical protein